MKQGYMIDGIKHTEKQVKKMFQEYKLGNREKITLSMINNPHDNKIIMDLGALYGGFAAKLVEKYPNSQIIAGDYLEEHLEIAKLVYPKYSHIYKKLNAYNLELANNSLDIITFQEVIEHLEGAAKAIKEINRVLKIGGELILSTPSAYYLKDMLQTLKYEIIRKLKKGYFPLSDSIYFKEHEWNRHVYCWTPTTLYTLLKVNGFEYISHAYCQNSQGIMEKFLIKIFPCFSPTIIMRVKKTSNAPDSFI